MQFDLTTRRLPAIGAAEAAHALTLPAGVRGFWTDEELLEAAELGSVATLRKLQTSMWLVADQIAIEGGGRRRAWTFAEVCRAAAAVEIARATGIALQIAVAVLARVQVAWMDTALDINGWAQRADVEPLSPASPPRCSRIFIVNSTDIWFEAMPGRARPVSLGAKLSGADFEVPRLDPWNSQDRIVGDLSGGVISCTVLDLSAVSMNFVSVVYEQRKQWRKQKGLNGAS